jgi:hypothetical protein
LGADDLSRRPSREPVACPSRALGYLYGKSLKYYDQKVRYDFQIVPLAIDFRVDYT